ncbi:hypothetical protein RRG08_056284 [Elysia crispata]|uniref:Uncharacterized protein n=1 Tax=Elysia crispata TaxID=231223 RepID=A0AAE1E714_9GAST|nr:hypothetical protein RRG08_056284 [Elysia crispata]
MQFSRVVSHSNSGVVLIEEVEPSTNGQGTGPRVEKDKNHGSEQQELSPLTSPASVVMELCMPAGGRYFFPFSEENVKLELSDNADLAIFAVLDQPVPL